MIMNFENTLSLGNGIYTISEISSILNIEYHSVRRLLNDYWNNRFAKQFEENYSWEVKKSKAVSFHTMIEFYVFYQFKETGVSTKKILIAHEELMEMFKNPFPFATKEILENIQTVGNKIIINLNSDCIMNLDATKQLNLKFIKEFTSNIDFGNSNIAERFYPLGKSNSIVVDPNNQFGVPTIKGTNIYPETIFKMYNNKESKTFISSIYELSLKQINDSIKFCQNVE